jgi:hypothetical protein
MTKTPTEKIPTLERFLLSVLEEYNAQAKDPNTARYDRRACGLSGESIGAQTLFAIAR